MIFILILASLAAVYYIAPLAESAVKPERQPPKWKTTPAAEAMSCPAAVLTPGLVALGQVLDQYGRDREQSPEENPVGAKMPKMIRNQL